MRNDIVRARRHEPTYEIRAIVEIVEKLKALGVDVRMENIGDPVAKGERIPDWMKEIVSGLAKEDWTYGYSPTRGLNATRELLAHRTNARGGASITPDDIIFFNGLGDAIQKVYGLLHERARVILPAPTYPAHLQGEAAHAGAPPITYRLDPSRGWHPNIEELRAEVERNADISAILVINPDNPTGAVFPERALSEIVSVAREYDLFIISDEVYGDLVYNDQKTRPISDLIGEVPSIVMKGISKELPWPGARCGWIEIHNGRRDAAFERYSRSLFQAKMVEVCATTLPQAAIPLIFSHPEYPAWLGERRVRYQRRSRIASDILGEVPGLVVNPANGAFYMAAVFHSGILERRQSLPIHRTDVEALVNEIVAAPGISLDKRFVYYLLASAGICLVPLSSFGTSLEGFRFTLLERSEAEFIRTLTSIADATRRYIES